MAALRKGYIEVYHKANKEGKDTRAFESLKREEPESSTQLRRTHKCFKPRISILGILDSGRLWLILYISLYVAKDMHPYQTQVFSICCRPLTNCITPLQMRNSMPYDRENECVSHAIAGVRFFAWWQHLAEELKVGCHFWFHNFYYPGFRRLHPFHSLAVYHLPTA